MHQQDEAPAGPEPVAQAPAPAVQETAPTPQAPRETATPEDGGKFEIHEIAGIFPPMREKEFEALVADIQEHGQFEPIWTHQGKIIDGRHRLRACKQLGMTPRTQEWDGEGSLLEFVIALNLRRRHLKETQRAMIAARMMPAFAEEARMREHAGKALKRGACSAPGQNDPPANWQEGEVSEHVGKILNVSPRSVHRARKLLKSGVPELILAVDQGNVAVSTAADLAELPKDEQARLIALGRKAIADALRKTPLSPLGEGPANAVSLGGEGGVPPASRRPEASGTHVPAPPLLAGEGVGGRGAPAPSAPKPAQTSAQREADAVLLRRFFAGCAKLTKNEQGFRIEFTDNCIDELCKAVENRDHFLTLLKRGVWMVWKQSA